MISVGIVLVIVACAGSWLARRIVRALFRGRHVAADVPSPFGYRMAWVAVKTRDTARLIELLGLADFRAVSWSEGIGAVYHQKIGLRRVFVTPPVDGWSFVVSLGLPHPMGEAYVDQCGSLLAALSREFGPVQYYASVPTVGYFAWAWLDQGRIHRGFASGEDGVLWNRGAVTPQERAIGCAGLFDIREIGTGAGAPKISEADVLQLAGQWSVDPTLLVDRGDLAAGIGYLAVVPSRWRARLTDQKAA